MKWSRYQQVTQRITVPVDQPFRFDLAVRYLQRSPDEIIDLVRGGRHYRVVRGADGLALVEIAPSSDPRSPALSARIISGRAHPGSIAEVVNRLYQPAREMRRIEQTEPLASLLQQHFRGLPVIQTLTPWEALVWAIIGQQINIAFAYRLKRAFVERFGERLNFEGNDYFAFPGPAKVAALDHEQDLLPIQFSRQKSRYVIEAARSILSGGLDFDAISSMDDEAATEALQQQLGVGRWTAEYVLLRGFGRLDVIPAGDAALKALVGQHLQLGRPATEAEVRELADHWKPWRGETAFMLWFAKQAGWFKG